MAKDPAFLFYSDKFLSGTYTMTDAQVGKYIRLLCLQHQQGHMTEEDILSVCKKPDDKIQSKFVQDENGLYYNQKLEEVISERNAFCQSQKEKIEKRWNKNGTQSGNTVVLPYNTLNVNKDNLSNLDKKKGVKGEKEKTEENLISDYGFSPDLQAAIAKWITYKTERRDNYKPTGLKALLTEIRNNANKHGEMAVIDLISICMASNWKGIIFERLEKQKPNQSGNVFLDMVKEDERNGRT